MCLLFHDNLFPGIFKSFFIFLRMDFINFVIAGLDLLVSAAIELAEICSIIQKDFLDSIS